VLPTPVQDGPASGRSAAGSLGRQRCPCYHFEIGEHGVGDWALDGGGLSRGMVQSLRLLRAADHWLNVQYVRDACRRAGLGPGDRVVDVGCGPLGALHVLSEVVGPGGTVLGLDADPEAIHIAQGVLRRRGLDRVTLVQGDVNALRARDLCPPGPFDAAYCRLLLVNQEEPAATLRRIAALVRSGGHIIAHELLDDLTYPVFDPPVPAFGRLRRLLHEGL
jgi:SAM-dependent methyltransferase